MSDRDFATDYAVSEEVDKILVDPVVAITAENQLATKKYVDDQVPDVSGAGDLLADGTIPMEAAYDPTTETGQSIATKTYVDATGDLQSDGTVLLSSGYTPSNALGLISKEYADALIVGTGTGNLLSTGAVPMDAGWTPSSDQDIAVLLTVTDAVDGLIAADGSVAMDTGYVPSVALDVATKGYADSIVGGGDLESDGSVEMAVAWTPSADQDIATKKYVDDNAGVGDLLADGSVEMGAAYTPSAAKDICTKEYTDTEVGGVDVANMLKSTGAIPMDIAYDPSVDQDIATKVFVDTSTTLAGQVTSSIGGASTALGVTAISAQTSTSTVADTDEMLINDGGALRKVAVSDIREHFTEGVLHVRDEKTAGTDAGTATSGSWETRVLNTVKTNTLTGASLSSNQITLAAGDYDIQSRVPGHRVDIHKAKLVNISGSTVSIIGSSEQSGNGYYTTTDSIIQGRISIAAETVLEIQHQVDATVTTTGHGRASNFAVVEVYAEIIITGIS